MKNSIEQIFVLRMIAVISVVIFHYYDGILESGFLGVDVFFVVSGFLMTKIICEEIEKKDFSLINFYLRRIKINEMAIIK